MTTGVQQITAGQVSASATHFQCLEASTTALVATRLCMQQHVCTAVSINVTATASCDHVQRQCQWPYA
jgi:hypothetical protein